MAQAATLNKIGTNVRIDLDRVKDRISTALVQQITENPRGKIVDYKMTDGGGIGLVIELSNGELSWFFDDEIGRS